jgi:hypothetical protein
MVTRQPTPAVDVPSPVNPMIRFCRRTARWIVPIGMYGLMVFSNHYLGRRIGEGPAADWLGALIPILLVLSMGLNVWRPRSAIFASIPFLMEVTICPQPGSGAGCRSRPSRIGKSGSSCWYMPQRFYSGSAHSWSWRPESSIQCQLVVQCHLLLLAYCFGARWTPSLSRNYCGGHGAICRTALRKAPLPEQRDPVERHCRRSPGIFSARRPTTARRV